GSRIEREPVDLLFGLVEGNFFTRYILRKQVEFENLVPHQVVFLTPCPRLIERQPEVVAIVRQPWPLFGILLGHLPISRSLVFLSCHFTEPRITGQRGDG